MRFDQLKLTYRILQPKGADVGILAPRVTINRKRIGAGIAIDPVAFCQSVRSAGEHFIFTCGCGVPGCARIYRGVIVLHAPDSIRWFMPEPIREPMEEDPSPAAPDNRWVYREYRFRLVAYRKALADALSQALSFAESNSRPVEIGPYGFSIRKLKALARRLQ